MTTRKHNKPWGCNEHVILQIKMNDAIEPTGTHIDRNIWERLRQQREQPIARRGRHLLDQRLREPLKYGRMCGASSDAARVQRIERGSVDARNAQ